jgi:hypothetical protein
MTDPIGPNPALPPYAPNAYPWAPPSPPPRSHTRRNALIAAAVVVVLVSAGLGGYLAFRGSGSSGLA